MSKWLNKFIDEAPQNSTDNTDRCNSEANVSVLLVPSGGHFCKNLRNMPEIQTDKTDRLDSNTNVSVLSVPSGGHFGKNLENMSETPTDRTDRFGPNVNVSVLSVPPQGVLDKISLVDDFEERLAISEYDGQQEPLQAQRIAYQDAFIAVLNTLPYEEVEGYYDEDWLTHRIKTVQNWLVAQGVHQPK